MKCPRLSVQPLPGRDNHMEVTVMASVSRRCSVEGCQNRYHAKGFCEKHYRRQRLTGTTELEILSYPAKFWNKVKKTDSCWLWIGSITMFGYGLFFVDDKKWPAHRYSYFLAHGQFPTDLHVRHKCDTPLCVNPEHLILGTHADNMRDMAERGRAARQKGIDHPRAKLSESNVKEIRALLDSGHSVASISRLYGVTRGCITPIKFGRRWTHV